jgi:hypothetical protein
MGGFDVQDGNKVKAVTAFFNPAALSHNPIGAKDVGEPRLSEKLVCSADSGQ